ncbi:MAG: Ref family recombination enhancement nuclease [Burkholderiaceae bacterium]
MTAASKRHMGKVAALGCILCDISGRGYQEAEVHHIQSGAMGKRANDFLTVPLCPPCHRGSAGRHGNQTLLNAVKENDFTLLAKTIERLTT